jgi:hypothetical protein
MAITPLIYAIAYVVMGQQKGPYWLRPNQDPDYAYLVNSLAIANFEIPWHIHHPGTPVQTIGAIALWISHAVQSIMGVTTLGLNEAVLSNPELHLRIIDYTLLGLTVLGLFVLGGVTVAITHRLLLGMLIQISPLLLMRTILVNEPSRVSPEALLFALSQILATLLVVYLYSRDVEKTRWFAISLGVVFGLGMATKVTFLPTVIFGLAIAGFRRKLLALAVAFIVFIAATLPIAGRYGEFTQWIFDIAVNAEVYGTGDRGLPSLSSLSTRLTDLMRDDKVFFYVLIGLSIICVIATIQVVVRWVRQPISAPPQAASSTIIAANRYRLILWLTLFMWSQILITIIESARSRYLIAAVGLCGLLLLLAVTWIESVLANRNLEWRSLPITCVLIYALCLGTSIQQYQISESRISQRFEGHLDAVREIEQLLYDTPQYQECAVVLDRRASSPRAALFFGNLWSGELFSNTLDELYPNSVFLRNIRSTKNPFQFWRYSDSINHADLLSAGNGCILLQSKPLANTKYEDQIAGRISLERLLPGNAETVYRVEF